ncbi:MAG: hypothetical protein ABR562_06655, partial [Thermoplasmatota archaeon]
MTLVGLAAFLLLVPSHASAQAETYWGASLPNLGNALGGLPGNDQTTTLAVTNISPTAAITATVTNSGGTLTTLAVPAASTSTFNLPGVPPGSPYQGNARTYKVVTSGPVMVSQFTPLATGLSNDATRLWRETGLGTDHFVYAYNDGDHGGDPTRATGSFVTVVATQPGTTVQITPSRPAMGPG